MKGNNTVYADDAVIGQSRYTKEDINSTIMDDV